MAFTDVINTDKAAESNTPSTFKRWSKNNIKAIIDPKKAIVKDISAVICLTFFISYFLSS